MAAIQYYYYSPVRTHLAILVHFVVGQLHLLEGHDLLAQSFAANRTVGMRVEASGWGWVSFAGDQPRRPVVRVTVAPRVGGHNVQEYGVAVGGLGLSQGSGK